MALLGVIDWHVLGTTCIINGATAIWNDDWAWGVYDHTSCMEDYWLLQ
jgi:hypothetical protein